MSTSYEPRLVSHERVNVRNIKSRFHVLCQQPQWQQISERFRCYNITITNVDMKEIRVETVRHLAR